MLESTEQLRGMRGNYATYEDLVMRCCDIADEIEQEIEERYIELPKDADGEYIHIGDVMDCGEHFGIQQVEGFIHGAVEFTVCDPQPARICTCPAHMTRHYHAPTVEDVLREFTDAILEWAGESGTVAEVGTWSDVAADFVKRLQLKEEQ